MYVYSNIHKRKEKKLKICGQNGGKEEKAHLMAQLPPQPPPKPYLLSPALFHFLPFLFLLSLATARHVSSSRELLASSFLPAPDPPPSAPSLSSPPPRPPLPPDSLPPPPPPALFAAPRPPLLSLSAAPHPQVTGSAHGDTGAPQYPLHLPHQHRRRAGAA